MFEFLFHIFTLWRIYFKSFNMWVSDFRLLAREGNSPQVNTCMETNLANTYVDNDLITEFTKQNMLPDPGASDDDESGIFVSGGWKVESQDAIHIYGAPFFLKRRLTPSLSIETMHAAILLKSLEVPQSHKSIAARKRSKKKKMNAQNHKRYGNIKDKYPRLLSCYATAIQTG